MVHDAGAPHVVIVGGFLTEPIFYRPMRRRLLLRGAASVSVAPIHWPDWMAVGLAGFGPLLLRTARAIRTARRRSPEPLMVVAHSAGGILARLAMSTSPFDGRRGGVAADVGCLVTLGTPHRLIGSIPGWPDHPGVRATRFLERTSPGTAFAPTTGYLTVGSTLVRPVRKRPSMGAARRVPLPHLDAPKLLVSLVMRGIVGYEADMVGDGIVGNELCRLEGARHVALPDALHGTWVGPWYGDEAMIERWWPAALEVWWAARTARAARHTNGPGRSRHGRDGR